MDVNKILDNIKDKLKLATDLDLAIALGINKKTLKSYRDKDNLTDLQISNLVTKSLNIQEQSIFQNAIEPIVEFYPITITKALKSSDKLRIISSNKEKSPEQYQLKCKLETAYYGLYFFYNSQGKVIYVGKTKNNLWTEMNDAFNRFREPQKIYSVDHTKKKKNIKEYYVYLHEIAVYFSAYEIGDYSLTDKLEALIIRSIPNDITNTRIEPLS